MVELSFCVGSLTIARTTYVVLFTYYCLHHSHNFLLDEELTVYVFNRMIHLPEGIGEGVFAVVDGWIVVILPSSFQSS